MDSFSLRQHTLSENSHLHTLTSPFRQIHLEKKKMHKLLILTELKSQIPVLTHNKESLISKQNWEKRRKKTLLTVARSCWSPYLGSILSLKCASAVSVNLALAISLINETAVCKSYSFLLSRSF